VPKQAGNDHPTSIPTGVFKTTDGHINIATTGGAIWERFCKALGADAMIKKPEYSSAKARSENRKALNAEIDTYTAKKTSAEWIDIMNDAGVPAGPIYNIDQVFSDPQVKHLGIAQGVKKRDKSTMNVVGQPIIMSRTKSKMAAPPPDMGQHTNEVLKEFGFSAKEIAALHKAKAV
jgi:crotonobetainyl-CoA:carnitine CoA-transferase CaiB-like acyl-CoA transferase